METMIQQKQELVRMIEGALKSEEDYKAGRFYTREQVVERTNRILDK